MSVFKYKFQISQQTQLKNSHKKKLKQSLQKQYPSVNDDKWNEIIPSKSHVLMTKLTNKIILYAIKLKSSSKSNNQSSSSPTDKAPIYFYQMKVYGKDQLYPTLHLLWKHPNFLPSIYIQSPVSQFILRGADLMLPGISLNAHNNNNNNNSLTNAVNLNSIRINDILSIKIIGNPLPFGVGYSIISSNQINPNNLKGRFMKMMHIYKDELCEFAGALKPNKGFLSHIIKPITMDNDAAAVQSTPNDNDNGGDGDGDGKAKEEEPDVFDIKFKRLSIDEQLEYGFFSTLLEISASILPVIVSDIYQRMSNNVNISQFGDIDVKKTKYKKLARFVQSNQFKMLFKCNQIKSKLFIESINMEVLAKYVLLLLNQIDNQKFDEIVKWFGRNQHCNNKQDNNDNDDNANDIQNTDNDSPKLSNKELFEMWYKSQYPNDNISAECLINDIFGGWMNILEYKYDINVAFLKHLSSTFKIILSTNNDNDNNNNNNNSLMIDINNPDHVFRIQFLETLKQSVDPSQLPISASSLLSQRKLYILKPNIIFSKRNLLNIDLNRDIITSVKQTRWKKSLKFLRDLIRENILQIKDYSNNGGEIMIININYNYLINQLNLPQTFQFFTPQQFDKFIKKIKELKLKESGNDNNNNPNNSDNIETKTFRNSNKKNIIIRTMYRANHRLLPIFGSDNISKLHTKNRAQTFLWSYINYYKLISTNNHANVIINSDLFHMLYDSKMYKKKFNNNNISINSLVHRKDLVNLFNEYMQPHTAIILDIDESPKYKAGYPPKIEIKADKRQGTKYMTHITGLEDYGINISGFQINAKKYFASATSVNNLSGKKSKMKGGKMKQKVSIQGNKVKDVPKFLMDFYGIPNQFINCKTNVTKQPKK